jgi:hypothetical protein
MPDGVFACLAAAAGENDPFHARFSAMFDFIRRRGFAGGS